MVRQFEIWIADLNPRIGTEPGKTRPVLIIQTDLLNVANHPSSIICPISTNVKGDSEILRIHLKKGMSNLKMDCDVLIDQIRAIDNKRLIEKIGDLPNQFKSQIKENLLIVLDLE
ncbi:MAG: type II toxin-antitoxin system PemK/MazF family toxin [Bacteroidetes bacterium]|nr:type II toxin-antitoxin system PemK/MazF family toxin [Bacteroidota bacterium]MDA1119222.1 type II toxin-antitoxin system PemK/MazF family toxin [Bacteroidota bacterium]